MCIRDRNSDVSFDETGWNTGKGSFGAKKGGSSGMDGGYTIDVYKRQPQTDVESYAAKLFGKDVKVNHQSLGDAEYAFEYDEEAKSCLLYTSRCV